MSRGLLGIFILGTCSREIQAISKFESTWYPPEFDTSELKIRRRQTTGTASGSEVTSELIPAAVVVRFPAVAALSVT